MAAANPNPTLIAIETSMTQCSVALLQNGKAAAEAVLAGRGHTELVLGMINTLRKQQNFQLSDCDAIAFSAGPGSFTGVRIAAALSQSMAYALNIPIIRISTLQTLAQGAYAKHGCARILCCVDARNHLFYWAAYELDAEGVMKAVIDDRVSPLDVIQQPNSGSWMVVGNGASALLQAQSGQFSEELDAALLPNAKDMLACAMPLWMQQQFTDAEAALPNYCRNDIAKTKPSKKDPQHAN